MILTQTIKKPVLVNNPYYPAILPNTAMNPRELLRNNRSCTAVTIRNALLLRQ